MIDEDEFWTRDDRAVATAVLGHDTVLFHVASGRIHHLNPSASQVWQACDGTVSLTSVIDDLTEHYRTPRAQVRNGVLGIVAALASDELLREVVRDPH